MGNDIYRQIRDCSRIEPTRQSYADVTRFRSGDLWPRLVAGLLLVRVALLGPGIGVDVVAALLPESAVVRRGELEAADPLGALPRVPLRDHEPKREAVVGGERLAAVRPCEQDVVVVHRPERE